MKPQMMPFANDFLAKANRWIKVLHPILENYKQLEDLKGYLKGDNAKKFASERLVLW